ncbi:cobalamin biosynthesis protein [Shimia sp. MMG029]|uniref:cobalamin biosynthesis protein n=1 Tax=Shimia sp. MMG029 TaxID=3021978 RepID=UPI0022FEDFF6|nr:cobalamin biosynthesis protein [Shimia sp. MMG029]MDA5556359.1 cobalamin biosynthesis protein [Shimia sp. MMG029]
MRVAGFGFRQSATLESLQAAWQAAQPVDVSALAAPEDKAQAQAFATFAEALSLPVIPVAPQDMHAAATVTNSTKVREKRGTGSVAEACALVAAGASATLLQTRVISEDRMATCAIAEGSTT